MALSNFLLTVAAVGAGFVLLSGDVRRSAGNLRRNLKHVKTWLEQEQGSSAAASKYCFSKGIVSLKGTIPLSEPFLVGGLAEFVCQVTKLDSCLDSLTATCHLLLISHFQEDM